MKNWTIGKRVITGFAALLILITAFAAINFFVLRDIKSRLHNIYDDALVGMDLSAKVSFNTSESERLVARHMQAKTDQERGILEKKISDIVAENQKILDQYQQSIVRTEDRAAYNKLVQIRTAYASERAKVLELSRAGKRDEAEAQHAASGAAFDAFQTACNAMFREDADFGDATAKGAQTAVQDVSLGIIGFAAFSFVVGVGFSLLIVTGLNKVLRNVAASLQMGSDQLTSASGQVSSASQALAEGSSEQAASLEETSSSLEEMSTMTKQNAENAQSANGLANQTRAAADAGANDMKEMSLAMKEIKESSDNIAKIIKTIDEIAFQTNILALNAAVEAARAGEAGMGFAVVAEEVRNLAQRSAQAAKETAEKIEDSIRKSEHGVQISAKVEVSLGEIVTKARKVDELVAEIAAASREQNQGIAQVNSAVTQMDKVTQSNAASAEETASAAEELNAQAETLRESVTELRKLVDGLGKTASSAPAFRPQSSSVVVDSPQPAEVQKTEKVNGRKRIEEPTGKVSELQHPRRQIESPSAAMGDFKDF